VLIKFGPIESGRAIFRQGEVGMEIIFLKSRPQRAFQTALRGTK
jgi:hypothetical protein